MTTKVTCKPAAEDFTFQIQQAGRRKCLINEGYLGLIVKALQDPRPRVEGLFEIFSVTVSRERFILEGLVRGNPEAIFDLSLTQANNLGKWIEEQYFSVVHHYHR